MSYAEKTSVSPDRTHAEIRKVLSAYKATGLSIGEANNKAAVTFEMHNRRIRFSFDIPVYMKYRNKKNWIASKSEVDQEIRRLWRCLLISIKSKLECVASGITTFEQEFLSHIVLPNNQTMGEFAGPQIEEAYKTRTMPPLLGYKS